MKPRLQIFFKSSLILLLVVLIQCGSNEKTETSQIRIVCTTGMVADLAKQIAAEDAVVEFIIPAGLDPHTYKPTAQNVADILSADIVIYSGIGLEARLEEVLSNFGAQPGKMVFSLGEALDKSSLIITDDGHSVDPHFWFDIDLWKVATSHVAEELSVRMPELEKDFQKRSEQYVNSLDGLKRWVATELEKIPVKQRVLVTVHDAFSYFGKSFAIDVRGLLGVSPEIDAGVQDISQLINFLFENEIPAVFVEESLPTKTMEAVIDGCQMKGHDVSLGKKLYADNVGEVGSAEDNYIGMYQYNVQTIVTALTE
ncbi:MAG TPA: manganese transporter [Flavobacteriales bacterium]|nr:manganese transporter [Flavobacteriales bacterium]